MGYSNNQLDMKTPNPTEAVTIPKRDCAWPHKLYLGRTIERTKTDAWVPMLEGRSSIGRLGLFIQLPDLAMWALTGFGPLKSSAFNRSESTLAWRYVRYTTMRLKETTICMPVGSINEIRESSQAFFTKTLKRSSYLAIKA